MSSFINSLTLGVVVVLSVLSCGLGEDQVASVTGDKEKSDFSQRTLDSVHVLKKRAPGWGKRSLEDDVDSDDDMSYDSESPEDILSGADLSKRAPGWGKRTLDILEDYTKRAPGWGKRDSLDVKRAPGWGKRDIDMDKRAPGWGKRAPGWGKRAPGWGKRAPGWGKRAPGWGKRAPGWGKRSDTSCAGIDEEVDYYIYRAVQTQQYSSYIATITKLRMDLAEQNGKYMIPCGHVHKYKIVVGLADFVNTCYRTPIAYVNRCPVLLITGLSGPDSNIYRPPPHSWDIVECGVKQQTNKTNIVTNYQKFHPYIRALGISAIFELPGPDNPVINSMRFDLHNWDKMMMKLAVSYESNPNPDLYEGTLQ